MKHCLCLLFFAVFSLTTPLFAEFPVIQNGKPAATIVSSGTPSKPLKHAIMQFQMCVKKLTGATLPLSGSQPYKIHIGLADKLRLPAKAQELAKELRDDGFLLYTDAAKKVLYITAKEERGLNHGVFELLKTYGGFRWIYPGRDGEFFKKTKNFILPDLAVVKNPKFRYRDFNLVSAYGATATQLWMLRNGMSRSTDFFGGEKSAGGHIFSTLLSDAYFKEKPELYCYYKGKRHPQCGSEELLETLKSKTGGQANQPCTSNPETVRIMCDTLKEMLRKDPSIAVFNITNNDSTQWCECENCKKLDPPEEAKRGMVSTRFWLLANELIKAGKEVRPDIRFSVSAYQTYQEYPVGVTPNPEAEISICPHSRCYLHSIGDPKCKINERFRKIMESYSKHGHKVSTYEYTDMMPRGEVWYLPLARLLAQDLKWYAEHGHNGWCDEVQPFDGTFVNLKPENIRIKERWIGNALDLYLIAALLWDPYMDLDAYEDEAGAIYYGKAWPVMKQYRRKLWQTYKSTNSHFCYGTPLVSLGASLEAPGAEKELKDLLAQALKAAAGDKRVETIVKRDQEFFSLTFEKSAALYRDKIKSNDVVASELSDNDPDWELSDWVSAGALPVKVAYKEDKLYVRAYPADSSADQAIEISIGKNTERFPLGKENIFSVKMPRAAVFGESVNAGVVYCKGQDRFAWNGGTPKMPDACKTIHFGKWPIVKNGSFEKCKKNNQGKLELPEFSVYGSWKPVTDNGAASGRVFLRGSGTMFQYLYGLRGVTQTYGIAQKYPENIVVRISLRGKGKVTATLKKSSLEDVGEKSEAVDSTDWVEKVFEFDISKADGALLMLYVKLESASMDADDIRIEKKYNK